MSRNRNRKTSPNTQPFPLFKFGLLAIAIALVAALGLQNLAISVTISFLGFATVELSLSLAMAAAFASGAIAAFVVNVLSFWLGGNQSPAQSDRNPDFASSPPGSSPSSSRNFDNYDAAADRSGFEEPEDRNRRADYDDFDRNEASYETSYETSYQADAYELEYETSDDYDDPNIAEPDRAGQSGLDAEFRQDDQDYGETPRFDRNAQDQDEWVDGNFYGGRTGYRRSAAYAQSDLETEEMVEYPPQQRPENYDDYYEADQVVKEEPKDYLEAKYIRRGNEED
jgi:hypothetical protein